MPPLTLDSLRVSCRRVLLCHALSYLVQFSRYAASRTIASRAESDSVYSFLAALVEFVCTTIACASRPHMSRGTFGLAKSGASSIFVHVSSGSTTSVLPFPFFLSYFKYACRFESSYSTCFQHFLNLAVWPSRRHSI